jgi:hypothetical protein
MLQPNDAARMFLDNSVHYIERGTCGSDMERGVAGLIILERVVCHKNLAHKVTKYVMASVAASS